MRKRVLLRYVLSLLIALPIGFLLLYPQVVRCIRIDQSDSFRLLGHRSSGIYISRLARPKQERQLQQHIQAAYHRIKKFWGKKQGKAILIYCPTQDEYQRYCVGGEGAGCSVGTPWGDSYLVLGPDGNNTDVIAHELCHDELFARLGWWQVKRQIPQWFNEGLALMVDYRFSSPSTWEHPDTTQTDDNLFPEETPLSFPARPMIKLTDLETTRDFFSGDYAHVMLAYQTAAQEVTRWLTVVGQPGVPALATAIANGETFANTYQRLERSSRKRTQQIH